MRPIYMTTRVHDHEKNHWDIFIELYHAIQATGNDIPDAYFAALAIESDCTWVTADKVFLRFPTHQKGYPRH